MHEDERFEIKGFWLSRHSNSPIWKATWYDRDARQTKRASLGTEDFQEAKVRLGAFVIEHATMHKQSSAETPLATVLLRYWHEHACNIPSAEAARIALDLWNDFWKTATVADLTVQRQEAFIAWLKAKGFKNAYVSRTLSVGRAAVRRAWKRQEITSAPFIMDEPDRSDEKEPYRLSKDEMRAFLTTVQRWPHLFTYTMIALNTLARPDAVMDLRPAQVNLEDRRINLNPKGRKQTKKYRPIVPVTNTLLPFVARRDVERFVMWNDRPIASIKKTFRLAVATAGLSKEITPYSLRHTMAAELRRRAVPAWEVEGLLGHRRPGVTETYAEFDPSYLSKGREAIDAYFAEIGLSYTVPEAVCVSVACHPEDDDFTTNEEISLISGDLMVGATGIEPVTPTMST